MVAVADPHVANQVLKRLRTPSGTVGLEHLVGNGLIISSGDYWLRERRLMQPVFHRQHVASMTETIVRKVERLIESWRGPAEIRDLSHAFRRLAQ